MKLKYGFLCLLATFTCLFVNSGCRDYGCDYCETAKHRSFSYPTPCRRVAEINAQTGFIELDNGASFFTNSGRCCNSVLYSWREKDSVIIHACLYPSLACSTYYLENERTGDAVCVSLYQPPRTTLTTYTSIYTCLEPHGLVSIIDQKISPSTGMGGINSWQIDESDLTKVFSYDRHRWSEGDTIIVGSGLCWYPRFYKTPAQYILINTTTGTFAYAHLLQI